MRFCTWPSKVEFEAADEDAVAGEFGVNTQWIQAVIGGGEVQDAKTDFDVLAAQTVANENIVHEEIVAGQGGRIAAVVLVIPLSFPTGEKAGRMIEQGKEGGLVEVGLEMAVGVGGEGGGDVGELIAQFGTG